MGFFTTQLCCLVQKFAVRHPWFWSLSLPRYLIVVHSRLRINHSLLPSHCLLFSLNSLPLFTLYPEKFFCNLHHILFFCPSLSYRRNLFLSKFSFSSCYLLLMLVFNLKNILFYLFIFV